MKERNRSGRGGKGSSSRGGKESAKPVSGSKEPATTENKGAPQEGKPAPDTARSEKGAGEVVAPDVKDTAVKGEPPPPPPPQPQKGGGCAGTALALLALLISLGVGGAGYYLWQQLQIGQQQSVQSLQQSVASRIEQVSSALQRQSEQKLGSVEQQVSDLKGEIAALGKQQEELRSLQQETALQEMAALNEKIGAISSNVSAAEQRLAELTSQQQGIAGRIGEADATLQKLAAVGESIAALEEKVNAAASRQQQLLDSIAALQLQADQERNAWKLGETEYLLTVATRRLALEHDIRGAGAALQAADRQLTEIGDSRWLPVREAISGALADLQALPSPDTDGAAVTLAALDDAVEQLPLKQPERRLQSTALDTAPLQQAEDLESWGGKVWESLKKLVIIRHGEKPAMAALLPPDQSEYLRQNLHLKLENARYALLRGNPELFRTSLGTAREWIEAHFDPMADATKGMLESLKKLQGMEFPKELPDISAPLQQLRKLRSGGGAPHAQAGTRPVAEEQPSTSAPQEQPELQGEEEGQDVSTTEPGDEQQEPVSEEPDQQETDSSPDAATSEGGES
ncbi:MAG TPA: hypothetical protein ENJ43_08305 [Gammaproteobacteria bacterium]|nr:hypothetical protein [Gammaproteobacteria bacterium]